MLQLNRGRLRIRRRRLAFAGATVAALLLPHPASAGSCCGGAAGPSLLVPKLFSGRAEVSFDWERYDGFWNQDGGITSDPPGSDLNQYRLNLAVARRLTPIWQAYLGVPYVWNDNRYTGVSSQTHGLGDTTLGAWWEAWGGWLHLGPGLTLPTGVSPYDDVESSFDVTGRGFYRLDANALAEKTLSAWDLSLSLGYGWYFERSVNREYGKDADPYRKRLGNRFQGTASASYTVPTRLGRWTGSGGLGYLQEEDGTIDGDRDPSSGFRKVSIAGTLAYSSLDRLWTVKASWSHALRRDGWGENFPLTDTYTLGVSHAFR